MISAMFSKGDAVYCHKCGKPNDDFARQCDRCGELLKEPARRETATRYIPNYLAQSILVTLFCCLPLGIPAIVYAAQVNGRLAAGDMQGACDSSRKARVFCWWSFGIYLFGGLLYLLFIFLATMTAGIREL
jgi:hypothetical protein